MGTNPYNMRKLRGAAILARRARTDAEVVTTLPRLISSVFAWLGGLAFVTSLSIFAWWYLVWLGRPAFSTVPVLRATILNAALFGAFAAHHSLMARARAKRWLTRFVPAELERSVYVWISSALLVVVCVCWQRSHGVVYALGPFSWIGYLIQAAGGVLILRSSGRLSFLELAGINQAAIHPQSASKEEAPSPPLVTEGLYGIVRHPLYLGWALLVFGAPYMTFDRLSFACISTLYLIVAIPWEEGTLRQIFGERYLAYSQRVRWRIFPGIY